MEKTESEFLINLLKVAYKKFVCDDPNIGWHEAEDTLYSSLVYLMGDDEFSDWCESEEQED